MTAQKMKITVTYFSIIIAVTYIGLWIIPVRMAYNFKNIEKENFTSGTVSIVEIKKKNALLPGPGTLWTVKTPNGYDVYRKFPVLTPPQKSQPITFPIDNFISGLLLKKKDSIPENTADLIISEKCLVQFEKINTKQWFLGGLVFSPNKKRIAYTHDENGKRCVITDGVKGKFYDAIRGVSMKFSPDGERLEYWVKDNKKWFFVVDGVEQKRYDQISQFITAFSPDSKRTAYVGIIGKKHFAVIDGNEEGPYDQVEWPIFSADSQRVMYSAKKEKQSFVVVNGKEQQRFDSVHGVCFSPDGRRMAYVAKSGDQYSVILDGTDDGRKYDRILGGPVLSPDGTRIAYIVQKGDSYYSVIDGIEGKKYDYGSTNNYSGFQVTDSIIFSPDSRRITYKVEKNGKECMVVDGVEGKEYDYIFGSPVFSPDSKRLAYHARSGDRFFLVIDGIEGTRHYGRIVGMLAGTNINLPIGLRWSIFSPDGKRVSYATVGKKNIQVILDGKSIGRFDRVLGAVVYSPDSKHAVCIAKESEKEFVLVDGVEKIEYEKVGLAGTGITFDTNNRFCFAALKNNGIYRVEVTIGGLPD